VATNPDATKTGQSSLKEGAGWLLNVLGNEPQAK
jgi:hypothetical protein